MAKKKLRYPNRKKNTAIAAAIIATVLILLFGSIFVNDYYANNVFTFDGESIKSGEYRYYLINAANSHENSNGAGVWEQQIQDDDGNYITMEEYVKKDTVETIVSLRIIEKMAKEYNVEINEATAQEVKDRFANFIEINGEEVFSYLGISKKSLRTMFEREAMFQLVYDEVVKDFVIDEAEFEAEYVEFLENSRYYITTVNVDYIFIESDEEPVTEEDDFGIVVDIEGTPDPDSADGQETAEDETEPEDREPEEPGEAELWARSVREMIDGGADFKELIVKYSDDYYPPLPDFDSGDEYDGDDDKDEDEDTVTDPRLESISVLYVPYHISEDVLDEIYAMKEGDVTGPIKVNGGYLIIRMDSIEDPTEEEMAEMKDNSKENYTKNKEQEIFDEVYKEWREKYDAAKINDYAFDRINVIKKR